MHTANTGKTKTALSIMGIKAMEARMEDWKSVEKRKREKHNVLMMPNKNPKRDICLPLSFSPLAKSVEKYTFSLHANCRITRKMPESPKQKSICRGMFNRHRKNSQYINA